MHDVDFGEYREWRRRTEERMVALEAQMDELRAAHAVREAVGGFIRWVGPLFVGLVGIGATVAVALSRTAPQ